MCGICGKIEFREGKQVSSQLLRQMLDIIEHRGPDEHGIFRSGCVGLAHRRLNIIDLSTGKQPMCNEDGSVWIIYNGEVYNFAELRSNLVQKGHRFKSASDTEVIVHLYEEIGVECVQQLRGMFSFALWDENTKTLLLARDRVGIKPLYYCHTGDSLLFASEIKAMLVDPAVSREMDSASLNDFFTYFYVPGEHTLFKNIFKLQPGHYMTVRNGEVRTTEYWDLAFRKISSSFEEATEELDNLLSRAVRDHMISDVPVGVLLSGGVDSSGVLSFAAENTSEIISSFTVGFDSGCTDERPYARMAANLYGARNFEITITAQDFWNCLPKYVWHMEEPVCEPPAIALYYVSKLAREHVTVLLSGEGGDEAFAGYQSYRNFTWLEKIKKWTGPMAGIGGAVARHVINPHSRFSKYSSLLRMDLPDYYYSHSSGPYEFFNNTAGGLYSADLRADMAAQTKGRFSKQQFKRVSSLEPLDQMLYVDTKTWLPDDLLIKADKMTMANSLELRVPLLDHQVLEFAASLPVSYKLKGVRTKHILKEALRRRLPAEILNRKKSGFPVPYTTWLSRELRQSVAEVLLDSKTIARGYFNRTVLENVLSSSENLCYSKELFSLMTLELWHRTFLEEAVACAV